MSPSDGSAQTILNLLHLVGMLGLAALAVFVVLVILGKIKYSRAEKKGSEA